MKKLINYSDNKLTVTTTFDLSIDHLETIYLMVSNDNCAEFENRQPNCEDVDNIGLSWKLCDELVEMGLLNEDEESYSVYFELNDDGKEVIKQIAEVER